MKLKLLQYGLMVICLLGNTLAMENDPRNDRTLYIGIRPWDSNVQEVKGLDTAHCVDFLKECYGPPPEKLPSTFHHLDINDAGNYSSGKFSEFALTNPEKFHAIIIDWMTYHHVHRDTVWVDFATLLSPGGMLVVPVTHGDRSNEKAQEIVDSKLTNLFSTVKILSHDTMPNNICFDLLRRDSEGITQCALSMVPAIIIATKKGKLANETVHIFTPKTTSTEVTLEKESVTNEATPNVLSKVPYGMVFKAPSVDEFKKQAELWKLNTQPFTFTKEGVIFKPILYKEYKMRRLSQMYQN